MPPFASSFPVDGSEADVEIIPSEDGKTFAEKAPVEGGDTIVSGCDVCDASVADASTSPIVGEAIVPSGALTIGNSFPEGAVFKAFDMLTVVPMVVAGNEFVACGTRTDVVFILRISFVACDILTTDEGPTTCGALIVGNVFMPSETGDDTVNTGGVE